MSDGPYTTIPVHEYARLKATMNHLRKQIQKARECLEKGESANALQILRFENDVEAF